MGQLHIRHTEAEIQAAIVLLLRLKYKALVAITDAGVTHRYAARYWPGERSRGSGMPAGWPDLVVLLPDGRFFGIEVKAEKGRQSKAQKLMQQQFEDLGHTYILARSVDDVIDAMENGNG